VRLHHLHASPQASRVEFKQPVSITWRGDGGTLPRKRDMARRLAVCWNVLEGIPTEALESGMLLEVFEAIDAGDIERARRAVAVVDAVIERATDGCAHSCKSPACKSDTCSATPGEA
jgi:hypothetical protein